MADKEKPSKRKISYTIGSQFQTPLKRLEHKRLIDTLGQSLGAAGPCISLVTGEIKKAKKYSGPHIRKGRRRGKPH